MKWKKTEYIIFTDNIIWLRRKYGRPKKKMAALLGIGLWSFNQIELHQLPPRLTVAVLYNVYRHFGVSPARLLTRRLEEELPTGHKEA